MGKEWLWWLGEFGLAAVVAIVAGFVTGDVPISILYGLFVGTVFFALREQRRVTSQQERQASELEDKVLNLPVTLSKLEEASPYMKRLAHSARDEAIRYIKGAADGEIVVKARHIVQVAIDVYKQAKPGDKVFSTNYWSAYSTPQSDLYRRTLLDLAANGVDITRVFIEGDTFTDEEKKRQREEMERLKDHLHVRFVKESLLPPEARKNIAFIVDRIYGYASSTSKGILFDEARFYTRREELDKGKELAETIIKLSEEYK
ncbi:MAG TPA: hypothetical protein G4O20_02575 [Dehalococcoidia bacterium]|nr:hypothetical protein [Dehalococcoidia bacterium]